jgi:hypothetical protein
MRMKVAGFFCGVGALAAIAIGCDATLASDDSAISDDAGIIDDSSVVADARPVEDASVIVDAGVDAADAAASYEGVICDLREVAPPDAAPLTRCGENEICVLRENNGSFEGLGCVALPAGCSTCECAEAAAQDAGPAYPPCTYCTSDDAGVPQFVNCQGA